MQIVTQVMGFKKIYMHIPVPYSVKSLETIRYTVVFCPVEICYILDITVRLLYTTVMLFCVFIVKNA